jgi:WD40 repeat protein
MAEDAAAGENVHLLCYSFNQDYSCFVCGTTAGFRVYMTSPVCEVRRRKIAEKSQANSAESTATSSLSVSLVRMLFKTNIFPMATVSVDERCPNKIQIWDDAKRQFIAALRSKYEVKGVAVRNEVIAMVCEYAVYVYSCDKLTILLHLTTARNERGLCALAAAGKPWVLACPGQASGTIRVQVGQDESDSCILEAHRAALAGLSVNASGSLIASASEHGTVVKVFSRNGDCLHQLRRSMRPATITSLAFRADDRFLAVASSSSTVHVFRIDSEQIERSQSGQGRDEEEEIAASQGTMGAESVGEMVKGAVPRYFVEPKSIAVFRIPDADTGGVDVRCSTSSILGPQVGFHGVEPRLLVLHYNGVLYEVGFSEDAGSSQQECSYQTATTWFATRPDFKVMSSVQVPTVAGGATEEEEEDAESWQLL